MAYYYGLPEKIEQVTTMLRNEHWCCSYVFSLRWPNGFICPFCGRHHPSMKARRRFTCLDCGKSTSLTSGTLMHGSKKTLSEWLRAIWWLCGSTGNHNIRELQQMLQLGSYQTAWSWMRKLYCAMQLAGQQMCRGPVEIDCSTLPLPDNNDITVTLVAVIEIRLTDWSTGRVRIAALDCLTPEAIEQFLEAAVKPGGVVFAPDKEPFRSINGSGYLIAIERGRLFHDHLSALFLHFKQWCSAKHQRLTSMALLRKQIAQFSFYKNSTLCISRQLLFEQLLRAILRHPPAPSHTLSAHAAASGGTT